MRLAECSEPGRCAHLVPFVRQGVGQHRGQGVGHLGMVVRAQFGERLCSLETSVGVRWLFVQHRSAQVNGLLLELWSDSGQPGSDHSSVVGFLGPKGQRKEVGAGFEAMLWAECG
jgi:hypothetical protein